MRNTIFLEKADYTFLLYGVIHVIYLCRYVDGPFLQHLLTVLTMVNRVRKSASSRSKGV